MTVSTTLNKINYTGNASTTAFTFPFSVALANTSSIQVFLTDTSGNLTQLAQPSQYTVVLNAPIAPNPTPVGGTVTLASAPANGVIVTIIRTMALTQTVSLANQGTLYQPVIEGVEDSQTMQLQQVAELLGRSLIVALSDPTPNALPPVAQRANQGMGFDSQGNPIAMSVAPAGVISSAMAPVVAASTIANALALLGLTGVQPEPPATIKAYAGPTAPTGYLMCNGQPVSRTGSTAALFAVIGTTYGAGDGSTTFNVPDLRGRVIAGLDNMGGVAAAGRLTSNTISGGATTAGNANGTTEQNTLSIGQLPAHNHTITDLGHTHTVSAPIIQPVSSTGTSAGPQSSTQTTSSSTTGIIINNTGSGNPVNNVQPTMVMNYIIKT